MVCLMTRAAGKMGVFGAWFPKNGPFAPIDFTLQGAEFGGRNPKNDSFILPKTVCPTDDTSKQLISLQ